jgi:hypothetical protein
LGSHVRTSFLVCLRNGDGNGLGLMR